MRLTLIAALLGWMALAGGVRAADSSLSEATRSLKDSQLQQRRLQQSQERLAAQLEGLRQSLAMAGRGALSTETSLRLLNQELAEAEALRQQLLQNQRQSEQQTANLLASLQRLTLVPPLMLSYLPLTSQGTDEFTTKDVAQAAILLNSTMPLLARRTQNLQAGILAIQAVERRIVSDREAIKTNSNQLLAKRKAIKDLLEHKARLMQSESAEYRALQRHTERLMANVQNLQILSRTLDSDPRLKPALAEEIEPSDPRSPRRMIPAVGKVIIDWRQRDNFGEMSNEQIIQITNSAMVVAPASGKVLLADSFKSYGNTLILSTRGGYLCIVAGVTRFEVKLGETVTVGQPIGEVQGSPQSPRNIFFQVLYRNQAIDPNQWVKARL
ncbi:MAG: peptidoglycan DD-metalloendopeptidase family protein [Candidatus Pacebacteria bacterium]|nr:peptidoglycan DD-metalloendopeptidase family protein [Candidatus Paceibacterota bacterium]